jgi:hypothetical protein
VPFLLNKYQNDPGHRYGGQGHAVPEDARPERVPKSEENTLPAGANVNEGEAIIRTD